MAVTVADPKTAALATLVSTRLEAALASVAAIGAGRNGRVYRVELSDGRRYVVKRYFRHRLDERDRLRTEFRALEFLWRSGLRCIPQPILADPAHDVAVYEAIEGQPLAPSDLGEAEIDQAVGFLRTLKGLAPRAVPLDLPPASEACFSVQAILRNVDQRLTRLTALKPDAQVSGELRTFLDEEFMPVHDQLIRWCMSRLDAAGLDADLELAPDARTLSPSDFGFHNALRRRTGELVFLDFEYFGWDDPAKTICDFLLHPQMALGGRLKRRFVARCVEVFKADRRLQPRTRIVYPLFGLKWCVILLNEFVPESLSRRLFAAADQVDLERLHAEQLSKARRLLQHVVHAYEQFPDCD